MKKKVNPIGKDYLKSYFAFTFGITKIILLTSVTLCAQIDNNGCLATTFGIDAGVYSNIIEFGDGSPAAGSRDWFFSTGTGKGTIDESSTAALTSLLMAPGNPIYEVRMNVEQSSFIDGQIWIDGLYAREEFGGTGYLDHTSFNTASKNGEDPSIWDPGIANVLGKNDLIDVAGHMFRNGNTLTSDLWFVGLINRAEPGGSAYMDFEFFVEDIAYNPGSGFTSGGPDLGHTSFKFDGSGKITRIGDIIYNVSLINGGETADVQVRLWVSRADYLANNTPSGFNFGPEYDGAFSGAPFGYASIIPVSTDICGILNVSGQQPAAPPWGTRGTKANSYETTYKEYAVIELGINMTAIGLDHASLLGADPCYFPLNTFIVKTRTSASFISQLKDFAGPFAWGGASIGTQFIGQSMLSCDNPLVTISANPPRMDATYLWTTNDGNILGNPASVSVSVSKPGTYTLMTTLSDGCPIADASIQVALNPAKPFFNNVTSVSNVACNGNDGSINITVSGATPPYTYLWSNSATTEDISGLTPGSYSVVITDNNGCTKSEMFTVDAKVPTIVSPSITDVVCNGNLTGAINLTVTGKSPFTYLWSTGNTSKDLLNIGAGAYSITITDADGCTTIGNYNVTQPPVLTASIFKNNDDTDPDLILGTGAVTLTATGGTGAYTYSWVASETGTVPSGQSTNKDLTLLDYGRYTVTVTDANLCTTSATVFIYEPEICNDGIDNDGDGLNNCNDPDCKPPVTSSITAGTPNICVSQTSTYSVTANPAAYDSYVWTVPASATISGPATGNSISVTWNSTAGGQVCVRGKKFDCLSDEECISVNVAAVPVQPGTIIISN